MKRLTYQTVGDATHPRHYCHGHGIKKDDLLQRLGKLEDAIDRIGSILLNEPEVSKAFAQIEDVFESLEMEVD